MKQDSVLDISRGCKSILYTPCLFMLQQTDLKPAVELRSYVVLLCLWQNNSVSPSDSLRVASEKHRSSSDYSLDTKKRKVDDKDSNRGYVSVCLKKKKSLYSGCFFIFMKHLPVSAAKQ